MNNDKAEAILAALNTADVELSKPTRRVGDGSIVRIHTETGIARGTIRAHLERLAKLDLAHVCAWTDSQPRAPIYAVGAGDDVPKPAPLTMADKLEYQRKHRAAKKAKMAHMEKPDREPLSPQTALKRIDDFISQVRARPPQGVFAALHDYQEPA